MNKYYIKIRQEIIQMLVKERKTQKLTQQELDDRLGINRPNLSRFERGEQNPTLDFLLKADAELGNELDYILKSSASSLFETSLYCYDKGDDTTVHNTDLLKKIELYKREIDSVVFKHFCNTLT